MRRTTWLLSFFVLSFGFAARGEASPPDPRVVAAETFPGSELGAKLAAADRALASASGVIAVNAPGEIRTSFTLHAGHALAFHAPVTWAATVTLIGNNDVACDSGIQIKAAMDAYVYPAETNTLMLTKSGSGISVHGCHVSSLKLSLVLAGYPMSNVSMSGNVLEGLTLAATSGNISTDLSFTGNTVVTRSPGSKFAAIMAFYAKKVTASGNHFTGTAHGVQWWGGDSGTPTSTLAQVTATGQMTLTGNVCKDVAGACLWGSMGYSIQMSGNSADGCGDVCFDTEGGLDTTITGNTAKGCVNGCAAMFFYGKNIAITKNTFTGMSPDGGLVFLKNVSQDPARYSGITVANNTLRCEPGPCNAIYTEAAAGVTFEANEISNGAYRTIGYGQSVSILKNHFVFTRPLPAGASAIGAPPITGGTMLQISGNTVESNTPQTPASVCIAATWNDFNASDRHVITGNQCIGSSPFPVGISTTTTGANPGTRATWVLSGNTLGSSRVLHAPGAGNEVYTFTH